jgi:tetratricopeptide (TPR) repeat protein
MLGKKNQSAVLAKYFSMYKKNPRSKVFAPLAESFRKLGLLDDAFKILKDGIRYHPNYTLGYIVLAHCYFDQGKFELTYNTLRPIISQNADNISLQKIFAQACMNLGYLDEALDIYKYLLFMNPRDKFFIDQVKKLEDDLQVGHKKLSLDQLMKAPDLEKIPASTTMDDDWVQVDFNQIGRASCRERVS